MAVIIGLAIYYTVKIKNNESTDARRGVDALIRAKASDVMGTSETPIYIIDNFMTPEECVAVIESVSELTPSTLTHYSEDTEFRTSSTGYFSDPPIGIHKKIEDRLHTLVGIKTSEISQIQKYTIGQQFKAHTDAFEEEDDGFFREHRQRNWTVMVYLSTVEEGGETKFVNLDVQVEPKIGRAVAWCSLKNNGEIDQDTMHQGNPVISGTKYIITKWFN